MSALCCSYFELLIYVSNSTGVFRSNMVTLEILIIDNVQFELGSKQQKTALTYPPGKIGSKPALSIAFFSFH